MDARANAQRLSRSAAVACLRVLTRNGFRAVQPLLVRMRVLTRLGLIKAAVACFLGLFCLLGAE
jgi:hypothetical protein